MIFSLNRNKNSDKNSFFIESSPYLSNNSEFKIKTKQASILANENKIDKSIYNDFSNNNTISLTIPKSLIHDGFKKIDSDSFYSESSSYFSNNSVFKIKSENAFILENKRKADKIIYNESVSINNMSLINPKSLIQDNFYNADKKLFYSESFPYATNNLEFKIKTEKSIISANEHKIDKFTYNEFNNNGIISFASSKSLIQDNCKNTNHNLFHQEQSKYLSNDFQHKCKNENFLFSPNKQNPTKFINNESKKNVHSTSTMHTILDSELPKNSKQSSFHSPITPYLLDDSKYVSKDSIHSDSSNKTKSNKYISNESDINKSNSTDSHKIVSHENFKNTNGSAFQPAQGQFQVIKTINESKYVSFDKKVSNGFICDENKTNKSIPFIIYSILHSNDFRNTDTNSFHPKSTPYYSDNFQFTNEIEDNTLSFISKSSFTSNVETQQFDNKDTFNTRNELSKSQIKNPIIQVNHLWYQKTNTKSIFIFTKSKRSIFNEK